MFTNWHATFRYAGDSPSGFIACGAFISTLIEITFFKQNYTHDSNSYGNLRHFII